MAADVDIVVISLRRAKERRKAIEEQFTQLGLNYRFFDAIDGREGHPLFRNYDPDKAEKIGELPLSPGHKGCYASHFLIWQECANRGKPVVVLEDDSVIFREPFKAFLGVIPNLPVNLGCVRLFESKARNKSAMPVFELGGVVIAKFMRGHKSTTGYYLTSDAAKKFITYGSKWAEPVDVEMDQFWANGVECYGVMEPCLTHNGEFESAIDTGVDTRRARRGLKRWRWRWYLTKGKIRRNVHNFLFLLHFRAGKGKFSR